MIDKAHKQGPDRVRPLTRIVALLLVPFLVAAFLILFFDNSPAGGLFARPVASPLTAAIMGAGYLAGAYFFVRVALERRWHRVAVGFPAVAVSAAVLGLVTLLYGDVLHPGDRPFQVWSVLNLTTPFLVTAVWWLNRREDDGAPDVYDLLVNDRSRLAMRLAGGAACAFALLFFLFPDFAIRVWSWPLTPLAARLVAGWLALLGAGALALSAERRWSGWRIPLQSLIIWQMFALQACFTHQEAFHNGSWLNGFTVLTGLSLLGVIVLSGLNEGVVRDRDHRDVKD